METAGINGDTWSEEELIFRMKNGSEKAFRALYEMYARRLYAFCMQYNKSREDTEEIIQDAFIWIWKSRSTIRQEKTIKNLLFLRVRHYLINAYRKNLNSPVFEDYIEYVNQPAEDDSSSKIEYDEFLSRTRSAIERLPETQSKVLTLSRLHGLHNKEIASKLNLSEQTVKNALSMGLKSIKARLFSIGISVLFTVIDCL